MELRDFEAWVGGARDAGKAARLVEHFARARPFLCNWQITYRCNFQCRICNFWREGGGATRELDLDGVRRVAERLRPFAPLVLSMAGGEPLLRSDLPDITRLLAKDHFFSLITNGWLLTREWAERLYEAGLRDIHVSIDYADPGRHDAQRGRPGAFERAVRALEHLRDARPDRQHRVHVMAVLLDDNLDEIEGLIRLAERLGVSFELSLYSHRRGEKPVRRPSRPVADYLVELKRRHPAFVSFTEYLRRFDDALERDGVPRCGAGATFLNIDDRGRVARCIDTHDRPAGSLLETPLERLLPELRRQAAADGCGRCWTSCRGFGELMAGPRGVVRSFPDFVRAVRPW